MAHAKGELRSFNIVIVCTLAPLQMQAFDNFCNLDRIVNGIKPGEIAEDLWNLYGDVAAPFSGYQTRKMLCLNWDLLKLVDILAV